MTNVKVIKSGQAMIFICVALGMYCHQVSAVNSGSETYSMQSSTIASIGGTTSSEEFSVEVTIGQTTPVGVLNSENYSSTSGFIEILRIVDVDVKPDDEVNVINPKNEGVVPVIVFSQSAFDASTIIVDSIRLAGVSVKRNTQNNKHLCSFADFNLDGVEDIQCHILVKEMRLEHGENEVELTARTSTGVSIRGTDIVLVRTRK